MGSFVSHLDQETGIPVRLMGDIVTPDDLQTVAAHHQGMQDWIKEHGLPWNSRKPWLEEIYHAKDFFEEQAARHSPQRLEDGGPAVVSPDGQTRLRLTGHMSAYQYEHDLEIVSTKLFPKEHFYSISHYQTYATSSVPVLSSLPVLGQIWSEVPVLRTLWLGWYCLANEVHFVWGPDGSELLFLRFRDFQSPESDPAEAYGMLDLPLLEMWPPFTRK